MGGWKSGEEGWQGEMMKKGERLSGEGGWKGE